MSSGRKLPLMEAWPLLPLLFCLLEMRGTKVLCTWHEVSPNPVCNQQDSVWGPPGRGVRPTFQMCLSLTQQESYPRYSGHRWSVGVDIVGASTGLSLNQVQSQQAGPAPKPDAVHPGAPGSLASVPKDTSRSQKQDGKLTGDHGSPGLTHMGGGRIVQLLPPATLGWVSYSLTVSIHPDALRPTWPLCLQERRG